MYNHSQIKECPITGHDEQIKYFDLGNIPLVNNLCGTKEDALKIERFPLNINYYPASGESSLDFAVDSELLFKNYLFKSEVNIPYIEHCKEMFRFIQNYVKIQNGTRFIDIGGNDGTLLSAFLKTSDKKINVTNVDPSENLAALSNAKGINTITKFFTSELVDEFPVKFDVVTSTNVFQHLKDINNFAEGVNKILNRNSVWILEFPYWIHDMKTNQFDQIYHEHMYYHSVTPMKMMMEKHGMKIVNVTKQNIHGGTLRLVIAPKESHHTPDITVEAYLQLEKNYGLDYHIKWGEQVQTHIQKSKDFINDLKNQGKTIYGFGAAAKGCIYLNAMDITEQISYIIDDTDLKQGKFVPGTGIEIVSREILQTNQPDYILILAHNFADYIIESLKLDFQGKFIILVPNIKVI